MHVSSTLPPRSLSIARSCMYSRRLTSEDGSFISPISPTRLILKLFGFDLNSGQASAQLRFVPGSLLPNAERSSYSSWVPFSPVLSDQVMPAGVELSLDSGMRRFLCNWCACSVCRVDNLIGYPSSSGLCWLNTLVLSTLYPVLLLQWFCVACHSVALLQGPMFQLMGFSAEGTDYFFAEEALFLLETVCCVCMCAHVRVCVRVRATICVPSYQ